MTAYEMLASGLQQLGLSVNPQAVEKLLQFSDLLLEKNKVMNLTAVTDPKEVVTRHFLDCAALASHIGSGKTVLDVGTGAGFPGIPLAILCPGTQFTLLDAQRKRIDFLKEVVEELSLSNVMPVHARAEEFAALHRASFDLAVSRAVADLRVLVELTLPMVKKGGMFYAMKAADCMDEVGSASQAFAILGAPAAELLRYIVPHDGVERVLVRLQKTGDTPDKYPRRFKKIQTDPL
ncbi:MAG TPA: 16S rRNA (guanine(527)-N(7))-methyltransferase RsmG [Candidatus Agathobaculum intestinipullorum]|nr:16S rRNA (guanine(527)-N(7))-methyltransferase RsmG [Candidatus Agathobaculum intestinipullorum]